MYNFDQINASYEYCTCITFADGHKTSFRKVEHIVAKRESNGYSFTFEGSGDENVDGKEPEEWAAITLEFAKAYYPYCLEVSEAGKLIGVRNFDDLKERWNNRRDEIFKKYDYNVYLVNESHAYMQLLESEKIFISMIRRNPFYHLLFWQDNLPTQELELIDFPSVRMISIFCFEGGVKENVCLCYKTNKVYDEGSCRVHTGDCTVKIYRDSDGLPKEITVIANVEKKYTGFYTKEITLKRL